MTRHWEEEQLKNQNEEPKLGARFIRWLFWVIYYYFFLIDLFYLAAATLFRMFTCCTFRFVFECKMYYYYYDKCTMSWTGCVSDCLATHLKLSTALVKSPAPALLSPSFFSPPSQTRRQTFRIRQIYLWFQLFVFLCDRTAAASWWLWHFNLSVISWKTLALVWLSIAAS